MTESNQDTFSSPPQGAWLAEGGRAESGPPVLTGPPDPRRTEDDRASHEPRWRVAFCFLLTLAAIQVALGPKIQLSQWTLTARDDAGVAEAVAWLDGRLDIPHEGGGAPQDRMHDTAYYDGKVYNVFPPLIGFLTVLLAPLHQLLLGHSDHWLQTPYVLLVFWPLPVLGFFLFRRETGDSAWAGLLTLAWMGGTSLLPCLAYARTGHLGPLNHVMSQTGLLILAADMLGQRRIWPGLIGLAVATWSRQMTCLFAVPLLIAAYRRRRLPTAVVGLAIIAAPLLTLNYLKFGNPLDFGYEHIYVNRGGEPMADRARQHGVFSPAFIGDNFWYIFFAPPSIDDVSLTQIKIEPRTLMGTGLMVTTPLAWFIVVFARRWWRDDRRRLLMIGSFLVIGGLLFYHSPGFLQSGFSRFSLDFLPIWLLVIAPETRGGRRSWVTIVLTALSLLYFQAITPNAPLAAKFVGAP